MDYHVPQDGTHEGITPLWAPGPCQEAGVCLPAPELALHCCPCLEPPSSGLLRCAPLGTCQLHRLSARACPLQWHFTSVARRPSFREERKHFLVTPEGSGSMTRGWSSARRTCTEDRTTSPRVLQPRSRRAQPGSGLGRGLHWASTSSPVKCPGSGRPSCREDPRP